MGQTQSMAERRPSAGIQPMATKAATEAGLEPGCAVRLAALSRRLALLSETLPVGNLSAPVAEMVELARVAGDLAQARLLALEEGRAAAEERLTNAIMRNFDAETELDAVDADWNTVKGKMEAMECEMETLKMRVGATKRVLSGTKAEGEEARAALLVMKTRWEVKKAERTGVKPEEVLAREEARSGALARDLAEERENVRRLTQETLHIKNLLAKAQHTHA